MARKSLMDRFLADQQADERQKKGLSRSLRSAVKEIAAADKRAVRLRKAVAKETMESLTAILADKTDMVRIRKNAHVQARGIVQTQEVLSRDIFMEMNLLDIQRFALIIEGNVSDIDVDNLCDANKALEEFDIAVNEYIMQALHASEEADGDKIGDMWDNIVGEKHTAVLMRATTSLESVRMHIAQVTEAVKNGECSDWQDELSVRLIRLFAKYNIDIASDDLALMFRAI